MENINEILDAALDAYHNNRPMLATVERARKELVTLEDERDEYIKVLKAVARCVSFGHLPRLVREMVRTAIETE